MPLVLAETAVTVACIYGVSWWVLRRRRKAASRSAQPSPEGPPALCSFCGKSQDEVRKLIAGPTVYICDECIDLCNDIIAEECEQEERLASGSRSRLPVVPTWIGAGALVLVLVVILFVVFYFAPRR